MQSGRFASAEVVRQGAAIALTLGCLLASSAARADPALDPPRKLVSAAAESVDPTDALGGGVKDEAEPRDMPLIVEAKNEISLDIGGTGWRGDFGGTSISSIGAVAVTGRYRLGDLRLSASTPYMWIRSRAAVFTGIDGTPLVVATDQFASPTERHGFGDLTFGASWLALNEEGFGADVDVSGRVKLPTAKDSTGLSTGKADFSAGVEVAKSFGVITPSARVTYRNFGDPNGYNLRNGFSSSAGISGLLFGGTVTLVSYDYAETASSVIGDSHEISVGASTPLGNRFRLNSFGSIGLSSGAPDYSAGISLSIGFGRRIAGG